MNKCVPPEAFNKYVSLLVNNYMVRLYGDVIVVANFVTRRTSKA